jgi:hypothetical protein
MEDPIKNLSLMGKIGLAILALLIVLSCALGIDIILG